jgi:PAS domain S-box-containing protein
MSTKEHSGFLLMEGYEDLKNNLINSIANPIFIKDAEHRWIMFNESFADIIDANPDDLLGKSDYDFFSKAEADVFWAKDDEVLKTGITNINEESLTDQDGDIHTILTSKVRIEDEKGNHYILGTITDVSEMKYDEVQLEKKNLQINAQKNEIKNAISDLHQHTEQFLEYSSALLSQLKGTENSHAYMQERIDGMQLLQRYFSETAAIRKITLTEFISRLSNRIPHVENRINLLLHGDPVVLSARLMLPLGLLIIEYLKACAEGHVVNEVRIEVAFSEKHLELEMRSHHPADMNDEGKSIPTEKLLQIIAQLMNGQISQSKMKVCKLEIEDVNKIRRGT